MYRIMAMLQMMWTSDKPNIFQLKANHWHPVMQ